MKVQNKENKTYVANVANVNPSNRTELDPLESCVLRHTANLSYKQLRVVRSTVKTGCKISGEKAMQNIETDYKVLFHFKRFKSYYQSNQII